MARCSVETIKEFKEDIEFSIKHGIKRSIYCGGPSGVGKSQVVQQVGEKYFGGQNCDAELSLEERKAKGYGDGWVDLRLLLYSETELKGIPYPSDDNETVRWLTNEILPSVTRNGSGGILILEELPAAARKVKTAAYQLCEDRKLGTYVLPDNWFIVALGNRQEDGGEFGQMPPALANRFEIHEVKSDFNAWKVDYAIKNNIHPVVLAYLNENEDSMHTYSDNMDGDIFASPRAWVAVSDLLKIADENKVNGEYPECIWRKVEGDVGCEIANGVRKYAELGDSIIKAQDILDGKFTQADIPTRPDAIFMVMGAVVSAVSHLLEDVEDSSFAVASLDESIKTKLENAFNFITALDVVKANVGFRDMLVIKKEFMKYFIATELDTDELNKFLDDNTDILA